MIVVKNDCSNVTALKLITACKKEVRETIIRLKGTHIKKDKNVHEVSFSSIYLRVSFYQQISYLIL
jgi:hypothetical protein